MQELKQKPKAKAAGAARKARAATSKVVSAAEAARMIDVTTRRLSQLVNEGWIERTSRGRYDVTSTVHGYLRFLREAQRRSTADEERARLVAAKANLIKARFEREVSRLIETDAVAEVNANIIRIFSEELASVPGCVADKSVQKTIRRRIEYLLTRLEQDLAAGLEGLRAGQGYRPA